MGLRETLRKAAGLLVEMPPEETPQPAAATPAGGEVGGAMDGELGDLLAQLDDKGPTQARTVEQLVRDTEGPNLQEITVPAFATSPPVSGEGSVDFAAVYQHAGLPAAPFTAEQMLEMMASLPSELPLDTKRQTVKVTLGAIGKSVGATPETIVADASRKLAALGAYHEALSRQTGELIATAEAEIAALQAQIEERRQAIQDARHKLAQASHACDAESDRLDDVLEFFSMDVAPSKYAAGASNAPTAGTP